jgi:probable extracellular repeat, HAF family
MTTYTYFNVDYPLAIGDTFAQGINNTGQIVGYYTDGGRQHGFVADPIP